MGSTKICLGTTRHILDGNMAVRENKKYRLQWHIYLLMRTLVFFSGNMEMDASFIIEGLLDVLSQGMSLLVTTISWMDFISWKSSFSFMKFCPFSSIKFPFIHSSTENSQMILHVCSSMIFGWLVKKEKLWMNYTSWMKFHEWTFITHHS